MACKDNGKERKLTSNRFCPPALTWQGVVFAITTVLGMLFRSCLDIMMKLIYLQARFLELELVGHNVSLVVSNAMNLLLPSTCSLTEPFVHAFGTIRG